MSTSSSYAFCDVSTSKISGHSSGWRSYSRPKMAFNPSWSCRRKSVRVIMVAVLLDGRRCAAQVVKNDLHEHLGVRANFVIGQGREFIDLQVCTCADR